MDNVGAMFGTGALRAETGTQPGGERGLVSSTRLGGRYAIRMCVMNHTSGPNDIEQTLPWFARARVIDAVTS